MDPATPDDDVHLGGLWRVAQSSDELRRRLADPDLDDSSWATLTVPGHWRWCPQLAGSDGPVVYRRRFDSAPLEPGQRAFLAFDGVFYQGDAWLDGAYLGDTEGYFFPHRFEVTEALAARSGHLLAVEVSCSRPSDLGAKRNLTGVFQHWDCIDPEWNPGGIWAPVRLERTGPVRIAALKVLCREAGAERAVLDLEARLDSPEPVSVEVSTEISREGSGRVVASHRQSQILAAGVTTVRWQTAVERPELWWPRALGDQPLYQVGVEVSGPDGAVDGGHSDRRQVLTGLRQIRFRNFTATVNGERLFLKGANYGPARRDLAAVERRHLERDVAAATDAGLDLLRVHGHISRPELYEICDRAGMLVWQDLPLQWGYGNIRRQAVAQAREAVTLLGHHPSVALWCGHNEPMALDTPPGSVPGARMRARLAAAQALPTWNKTVLDRSVRRALERSDGTRTVLAHSGVVPHPVWGTDSHLYLGWYAGDERDLPRLLRRLPVLARFVGEFGAQAVPETADFMDPSSWPALDWDRLQAHHGLQKQILDSRVPPAGFGSFGAWRAATQEYQARLLRHQIETLRRLKYRPTGGFCMFMLADAQPAISWSVLDHERIPKAGYRALVEACRPVIVVADRPQRSYRPGDEINLAVHAVSDLRAPSSGVKLRALLEWPGGARRWTFAGDLAADSCVLVGRLLTRLPPDAASGPLSLHLEMTWAGGRATNHYESLVGGP